jgi:5'-nucleotidase / UDP-sugar diphosphatase
MIVGFNVRADSRLLFLAFDPVGRTMPIKRNLLIVAAILCLFLLQGCANVQHAGRQEFDLTIAHVNDTHSHLETVDYMLKVNGEPVNVELGGMARLKSALDDVRAKNKNVLFLHAGDMVQGTLYFTKYDGKADMDMLNMLGLDAAIPGNHEFDKGPRMLASLISMANFPVVSSNIDVSKEPSLAGRLAPYAVRTIGEEKIGIIGITTTETPAISNPGPMIRFADPAASVIAAVAELHRLGVRKIVVLSHCGYAEDIVLAKKISHVAVIVGGHTHTLLGDTNAFGSLGLKAEGAYPTVVKDRDGKDVLIVQAWEWAKVLGRLNVRFNPDGSVLKWSGSPILLSGSTLKKDQAIISGKARSEIISALRSSGVAGIYEEDASVKRLLTSYSGPLKDMMTTVIARVSGDLKREDNAGPGPLVADSMLSKTHSAGVRIAIQNKGGIRKDIAAGDISVADVYELMPFNNTLVIIELKGSELIAALEQAIDFKIAFGNKSPYLYVSGICFRIDESEQKGGRIRDVKVGTAKDGYMAVDPAKTYRIVASSYLAGGGDGMTILMKASGYRLDTGFTDAEVFMEYLKAKGTIDPPTEKRISLLPHDNVRIAAIIPLAEYTNNQSFELLWAA